MTGERTPIRRRLDKIFPPVWNLCESNTSLVETIGHFNQATTEFTTIPVQRIIDTGKAEKAGSCYYGQLTNMGRAKMSSLGVRLREAYIDKLKYLPDVFDEETVYIRSTDYPRTRESVQQLIAGGLYPADKRPEGFQLKLRIR
ncbi:histidine phosphatase superfamily [Sporodiniella umbellata]|nr:histidine phosphatase superfamily [Sporodiniella umbellata]